MLEVYSYEAGKGDCVRLRYGNGHNVFVDTGTTSSARRFEAACREASSETLDLLVLTHVDDDHIGGILSLLRRGWKCPFAEVGMNWVGPGKSGRPYLSTAQNNEVLALLREQGVSVRRMMAGDLFDVGGATITVVAPRELHAGASRQGVPLARKRDFGRSLESLARERIRKKDSGANNRDSIVFTFEHEDHSILLTGDAWAKDIAEGLGEGQRGFDLVKLPHHGSVGNISEEFPRHIACRDFLVCTDGREHPDKQTIAKLLRWYGHINVYSPSDWWSEGFFTPDDDQSSFDARCCEGLVISW